jgi:ABC-type sugar transport system ATPase subunit
MLQITNVSKDMGEFFLDSVSLEVQDGDYLVIIGPTGAGKTILLETVAGIYEPDSGETWTGARSPMHSRKTGTSAWYIRTTCSSRT